MSLYGRMTIFAYGAKQVPINPFEEHILDIQVLPTWTKMLEKIEEATVESKD
ncbi:hypothetical protein KSB_77150 [Ktedonobacter robiniae]|uniref:Uncharacterized protein n=1 Tax=Ktedonobacter robiniae TaxID=2778365 RepID=A0ABQ3V3M0_9CHLR|nr:hypothetical protein KSB_77150 [Ktedonobacter robiniae]